jgi:hypothetical protein
MLASLGRSGRIQTLAPSTIEKKLPSIGCTCSRRRVAGCERCLLSASNRTLSSPLETPHARSAGGLSQLRLHSLDDGNADAQFPGDLLHPVPGSESMMYSKQRQATLICDSVGMNQSYRHCFLAARSRDGYSDTRSATFSLIDLTDISVLKTWLRQFALTEAAPAHYLLIAACFAAGHADYRPGSFSGKEIPDDD